MPGRYDYGLCSLWTRVKLIIVKLRCPQNKRLTYTFINDNILSLLLRWHYMYSTAQKWVTTLSRDANHNTCYVTRCMLRDSRHVLCDSCSALHDSLSARWPKNCKYHCQNSWAISRISGKVLPWLTHKQILTSKILPHDLIQHCVSYFLGIV